MTAVSVVEGWTMNRACKFLSLLLILVPLASAQQAPKPQVFAPGIISGKDVFGSTFSSDGKTVYFCETDPEVKHIQIMESHRKGDSWSAPKAAGFSPGPYRDIDPSITPDGRHLIFESNRPGAGRAESRSDFDIYVMERQKNGWSEPRSLTEVNSELNEVFATAALDGSLIFGSDRPGGKGKLDIYMSRKTAKGYGPPTSLNELNTDDSDGNPAVAPNGRFLIFSRAGDLLVSRHNGDHWSQPEKLPLVNTVEDTEYAPAFSPDGKTLFYTSTKFESGKRVKPGTIWFVPLSELGLPNGK
jgi:Tol biopolymer transport system component